MLSSKIELGAATPSKGVWKISSGLHKKTLVFFTLLILLASILSIVAIYHHSRGEAILDSIAVMSGEQAAAVRPADLDNESLARGHVDLEGGLTVIAMILVSVLIMFMFFFIRNIIQPLGKLEKITRDMADGRLDRLVLDSKNTTCSIGAIGENVNCLAMNLQEVLLLVWNLSEHNLRTVADTIDNLEDDDGLSREQIGARLRQIKAELKQMQDLTRQFEFFDVTLRDNMALAKDNARNSQPI